MLFDWKSISFESSKSSKGALQFIVPILMQILTKKEEFDDDDWNPCKAGGGGVWVWYDFI